MNIDVEEIIGKKSQLEKTTFSIQPWAPVFIGSGQEYFKGIDFYSDETHTYIFNHNKLFRVFLETEEDSIQNLQQALYNRNLKHYLETRRMNPELFTYFGWWGKPSNSSIDAPVINGLGKPIIPGSSLKGSIRTALFAKFFDRQDIPNHKYRSFIRNTRADENVDDKDLQTELLRTTENDNNLFNCDIGRAFRVSDASFFNSKLEVFDTIRMNENREGYRWMYYHGGDTVNLNQASKSSILAFSPLTETNNSTFFNISIDQGVLKNKTGIGWTGDFSFKTIAMACNELSLKLINEELDYLNKAKKDLEDIEPLINEYENLKEDAKICIKEIDSGKNLSWVQRVGKGIGWHSMTGAHAYDDNQNMNDYMRAMKREGDFIEHNLKYPKTRRIVLDQKGEPSMGMGWLYVEMEQE